MICCNPFCYRLLWDREVSEYQDGVQMGLGRSCDIGKGLGMNRSLQKIMRSCMPGFTGLHFLVSCRSHRPPDSAASGTSWSTSSPQKSSNMPALFWVLVQLFWNKYCSRWVKRLPYCMKEKTNIFQTVHINWLTLYTITTIVLPMYNSSPFPHS